MFEKYRTHIAEEINTELSQALDALPPGALRDAMRWGVEGGKCLRGFLVIESGALYNIPKSVMLKPALAVEALHAYSLIHDDLPDMDNDTLRRGRATVHIKWNNATAILAGDALQSFAFSLLAEQTEVQCSFVQPRLNLIAALAKASGAGGMVRGQARDLAAEKTPHPLSIEEIESMQKEKTGALICWASTSGAVMANKDTTALARYGQAIGLAFQISDDLLDATGDIKRIGKKTGKDKKAGKATFVELLGIKRARQKAEMLVNDAKQALQSFGTRAKYLNALADFVIERKH